MSITLQLICIFFLYIFDLLKLFTIILSIYVTCLALVPCSDFENIQSGQELSVEATHDHDHPDNCNDSCTPFCMCACCHTNVVVNKEEVDNTLNLITPDSTLHDFYTEMETTPYLHVLFHPPIA